MRYTFTNAKNKQTTVEIPDSYIKSNCAVLKIKPQEAIQMWLSDNGYVDDETIKELTEKAKHAGIEHGEITQKRQAPRRKPDAVKRALIEGLVQYLKDNSGLQTGDGSFAAITGVEATNIERIIAFTIGGEKYELTLSKKRKG